MCRWVHVRWRPSCTAHVMAGALCLRRALKETQRWMRIVGWAMQDHPLPPSQPSLAPPKTTSFAPPPAPPGKALGASLTQTSTASPGGGYERVVSSSLFISVRDLWTCLPPPPCFFMSRLNIVYLHNWYPGPKGKSLCPHIICKLSPSPRTDLFTGWESVLYYAAATRLRLSSSFNVTASHSGCSVWGLNISSLKGGGNGGG